MNADDWAASNELADDPYRHCAQCDQTHHEDYGHPCEVCDEWICTNCWQGEWGDPPHEKTDEHAAAAAVTPAGEGRP